MVGDYNMDDSHIKEELSINYINTIACMAGIDFDLIRPDGDSTDAIVKKWIALDGGLKFHASLRVQLKTTSSETQYSDNGELISYQLKVKNYNDLCMPATTPIILGLLVLPKEESDWVKWTAQDLMIKGCMYWGDFSKRALSTNSDNITVKIEKKNVINSETLQSMLENIAREGKI